MTEQERECLIATLFQKYEGKAFAEVVLAATTEIKNYVWERIYQEISRRPELLSGKYLESYIIPLLEPCIYKLSRGVAPSDREDFKWCAIEKCVERFFEYNPYIKEGQIQNGITFFEPIIKGVRSAINYFGKGYQDNLERFVDREALCEAATKNRDRDNTDADEVIYDILYHQNKQCFAEMREYFAQKLLDEYYELYYEMLNKYTLSYAKKLAKEEFLKRHPEITEEGGLGF